jgi:hypothetical protein
MRLLAAKYANVDPATRGWRRILAAERECSFTPFLLAGRSNAELSAAEVERFERHLGTCLICQAAELRFERAERVFDGVLRRDLALEAIASAMQAEQATTQFERLPAPALPSEIPEQVTKPIRSAAPASAAAPAHHRLGTASLAAGALVAALIWARARRPVHTVQGPSANTAAWGRSRRAC